ncbi:2-oxoacid:acceptor oxidoreductase family protein [Tepidimicrobium xylanilyticum]|uniref:2-oxoglutarate ferredoxin oxidoreductase, gamma subunit n=1 Tax=Tepidimicrobium xylanilyticum TaxID=1123352 RepID=A0A1H3CWP6_9FIRM|nr:2-oxoacid:acceptor oxidoreductase family protein [Tepidimicrobium xylanilyticum]GMG97754.1 2-oxoglutarate ferredoxin oxidoreductase subunit gamma [Tepidimicrobium xylanilyticum]SDX58318.1 2-oxoglutarate ferredoxin oxidoreductase, gamma subunit [Tepidimicrobium xylanilyticum]
MIHQEFRLSGSGGQGLILAGIILAEAALYDGKNVVQSQSYGPEARGGASKAEVIISDSIINYPKVDKCDVLLALTESACNKYINSLKEGGTLIIDDSIANKPNRKDIKIYSVPILDTATNKLGKPMVANIVALGSIYELTNVVSKESLEKAVLNRVPRGTEDLNKKALEEGFNLIKN